MGLSNIFLKKFKIFLGDSLEGKKVSKKTRRGTGLFKEKVFRFLWGCSKNYIMYWGGYVYYNSIGSSKSVHKVSIFVFFLLCILSNNCF